MLYATIKFIMAPVFHGITGVYEVCRFATGYLTTHLL